MLEIVREFALEQSAVSGEEESLQARHASCFAAVAAGLEPTWWTPPEITEEQSNIRAALDWSLAYEEPAVLLPLALALYQFVEPVSSYDRLEQAVAATTRLPPSFDGKRARLLAATAHFALLRGDTTQATALLEQSQALARQTSDQQAAIMAMVDLGYVALGQGDFNQASTFAAEAILRARAVGNAGLSGEALGLLGRITRDQGDFDHAEVVLAESLGLFRTAGFQDAVAGVLLAIATCALQRGNHRRAAELIIESLTIANERNSRWSVIYGLEILGSVVATLGRFEQAARLFGTAEGLRERIGLGPYPTETAWKEDALAPARSQLSAAEFAAAWASGRSQSVAEAISAAIALAEEIAASTPGQTARGHGLTPRELDVLRLLAEGRTDREIAQALFISPRTVMRHVTSILDKLGVENRTAATRYAVDHGLI